MCLAGGLCALLAGLTALRDTSPQHDYAASYAIDCARPGLTEHLHRANSRPDDLQMFGFLHLIACRTRCRAACQAYRYGATTWIFQYYILQR